MTKLRAFDPSLLRVFVLDEADVMISQQGHHDQSIRINQLLPANCQHLLFSATYDNEVMEFAESLIPDAIVITVRREEQALDNIRQYWVECPGSEHKFRAICNIYSTLTIGQSIIFCHTRRSASWLAGEMSREGHAVALLSGELDIEQRALVIQRFKAAQEKVLITTNVCARGIDVQQVTIVINYDLPFTVDRRPDLETYLHRIGRTGRFGKPGIAVNFVDGRFSHSLLDAIQQHFGKPITKLDTEDYEALEALDPDSNRRS